MSEDRTKILCIEDDDETATLIAEDLNDRGFDVSIARGGQEGLTAIQKQMPDLVLLDLTSPTMARFELPDRLAAFAPALRSPPFVFFTAPAEEENRSSRRELGADEYVTKPIDFDRLDSLIKARLLQNGRRVKAPGS
jgi:DNA-binding response OmpR family regulator